MSEHNFEEIKKNIYKQPIEQLKDDIESSKMSNSYVYNQNKRLSIIKSQIEIYI